MARFVGSDLMAFRKGLGLTVSQIAPVFGVHRHTWGRLEGLEAEVPLTLRWALAAHGHRVPPVGTAEPRPTRRVAADERARR